jgi:hypothetical protein
LDAIDCLEVRTVPKEELVPFAEPEVGKSVPFAKPEVIKEEAPNEGHRQSALTGPMRDAHFVALPAARRLNAPAARGDASALLAVQLR